MPRITGGNITDPEALRRARDEIASEHGEWTSHDISLADGVSTRMTAGDPSRVRRVTQLVADLAGKPFAQIRALDLGALEGQYAIELALQGAEVVAIEGRLANVEKARFARDALGLDRLELRREDVRALSQATHGRFDVVLCLGLLYHLDAADVFPFLERLAEACTGLLIVDTHVGMAGRTSHRHRGREYRGVTFVEHSPRATQGQRERSLWASLDNVHSFWPTRASLLNALTDCGFTSVLECETPYVAATRDRITLVARRGERVELRSVPGGGAAAPAVPERRLRRGAVRQDPLSMLAKRALLRVRAERERLRR